MCQAKDVHLCMSGRRPGPRTRGTPAAGERVMSTECVERQGAGICGRRAGRRTGRIACLAGLVWRKVGGNTHWHPAGTQQQKRTCTTGTAMRVPGDWSLRWPVIQARRPVSCLRSGRTCGTAGEEDEQTGGGVRHGGKMCACWEASCKIDCSCVCGTQSPVQRQPCRSWCSSHLADAAALAVAVLVEGEEALLAHQVHHLLQHCENEQQNPRTHSVLMCTVHHTLAMHPVAHCNKRAQVPRRMCHVRTGTPAHQQSAPGHRGRCTQCGCRSASPPCQTGGRSRGSGGQCPGCSAVERGQTQSQQVCQARKQLQTIGLGVQAARARVQQGSEQVTWTSTAG